MYDGSNIISTSVQLGQPIIYVAVNYRLGGYGFLHGKELAAEGGTNLGLRDQRLGLEWVADNIAAFGGDPSKVTIWGESAGAISVADQTLVNGGDNTYKGNPLFRGAIMNSGSIIPATDSKSPKAQAVYDTVVANAGCSGSADTLACLRGLSQQAFQRAVTSVPGIFSYQSVR
jgi:carboxylesterase type B